MITIEELKTYEQTETKLSKVCLAHTLYNLKLCHLIDTTRLFNFIKKGIK